MYASPPATVGRWLEPWGWTYQPLGLPSKAASQAVRAGLVARPCEIQARARARAAIVNEAARILEEGIAASPSDIDLVLIYGYRYPVWRGGPIHGSARRPLSPWGEGWGEGVFFRQERSET